MIGITNKKTALLFGLFVVLGIAFCVGIIIAVAYIGVLALLGQWHPYVWIAPLAFGVGGFACLLAGMAVLEFLDG